MMTRQHIPKCRDVTNTNPIQMYNIICRINIFELSSSDIAVAQQQSVSIVDDYLSLTQSTKNFRLLCNNESISLKLSYILLPDIVSFP